MRAVAAHRHRQEPLDLACHVELCRYDAEYKREHYVPRAQLPAEELEAAREAARRRYAANEEQREAQRRRARERYRRRKQQAA